MMSQCVETQSITQCKDQKRLRRRSVDGTKSQNPTVAKKPKWKYSRSQTLLDFSTQSGRVSPPPVLLSPSVPRPSSPESYSTSSVGTATQSLEQDKAAENHSFSTDLRARLHNWALLFSLPHLVMLSNLQKLIGVRSSRPTIQPNEYMDNLLSNAKATMKERGLNRVSLPDQQVGVALYDGKMTGLTNLHRRGDAVLEAETDHFILSFAIDANDIRATYWWKKRRLKGEVTATVAQVTLQLKIKQMIQNSPPPELLAFTVEKIDGIQVSMYGLGPLNWVVRKVLRAVLRRHLRDFLEREGKEVVQQELENAALASSEGDLALFSIFLPL